MSTTRFLQNSQLGIVHWSLSNKMFLQVSRTFLSILQVFKKCCSLEGLDSSYDFWFFQSPLQVFKNCSKRTDYTWDHHPPSCSTAFFSSLARSNNLLLFRFLSFSLYGLLERQNPRDSKFSGGWRSLFCFVLYASQSVEQILFAHIPLGIIVKFKFLAQFPVDPLFHHV